MAGLVGNWVIKTEMLFLLSGCCALTRNPVPVDRLIDAEIKGMPNIRSFGGRLSPVFQADLIQSAHDKPDDDFPRTPGGAPKYNTLALSGCSAQS